MESGESTTIGDGRYAVARRIGLGGCGAVYLAHDTVLNRWVAIKRVEIENLDSDPLREARQLASLQHPNIVTIHDFLRSEGEMFVVMEYVVGQNLNELAEPMTVKGFTGFARQSLDALAAAHAIGMVHRDIKPANIMLATSPAGDLQAKLLDFGLAKVMSEPSHQTMDHSGAITGSIHTISPEQLNRHPLDHRADLYSLGCVFYKALTLRYPFDANDVPALIAAHLQHDFTPLSELRPDLPEDLAKWVEQLFAYDQNDRPQSAAVALRNIPPYRQSALKKTPHANGKPLLTNSLAPKPASTKSKSHSLSPSEVNHSSNRPPFYRTQNFGIAMVALIAVCVTIMVLALTGHLGGSRSRPAPMAKKEKAKPTPAERTSIKFSERSEIKAMAGKSITVTGDIDRLEQDEKGRYLVFKDSDPRRDVMVFFDTAKTETSEWILKRKFAGQKVRATGTVKLDAGRLLLELTSMDHLKLHADEPMPQN
jgi:serine/threonine protein kinase